MGFSSGEAGDAADAIAAALARLRGSRGRPPWADGPMPRPEEWMRGGPHRAPGGFGMHDGAHRGMGGMGHWGPHARFAGPARLRLLEALAAASDPLTVSAIADAIGVDQPRASRLVQQSVEMGLVRREADPADARRTRIVLTDSGTALVRGFRGDRRQAVAAALASFSDDERAELARLLTKLAESWPR